jgi:hypothetical protein
MCAPLHRPRVWDAKTLARLLAARRDGVTLDECAVRFGVGHTTIERQIGVAQGLGTHFGTGPGETHRYK